MRPNEEGAGWTSELVWSFGDLENRLHLPRNKPQFLSHPACCLVTILWYPKCTNLPTFQRNLLQYWYTYENILYWMYSVCISKEHNYVHLKSSKFPSGLLRHKFPSLGALAKLWKVNMSFIMSIQLSTWNDLAPTECIYMKIDIWVFFEDLLRKFRSH